MSKTGVFVAVIACAACARHEVTPAPTTPTSPEPALTPDAGPPPPTAPVAPPPPDASVPTPDPAPAAAAPAPTGFARFDDSISGNAPWLTDDEVNKGIGELVALMQPGDKGTFTTRRVCGAEAKAAVATLGELFVARASNAEYDPVACLEGPPPSDKVVCLVAATDNEGMTILLDYRKKAGAWHLVGVNRTTHTATLQPQYKKLQAQYDKVLTTKCK